jgi:hypothetical protein
VGIIFYIEFNWGRILSRACSKKVRYFFWLEKTFWHNFWCNTTVLMWLLKNERLNLRTAIP